MENEIRTTIDVLVARVDLKTTEIANIKRMVNDLCKEAGIDAVYSDAEIALKSGGGAVTLKPDEFYGKSPITASRKYLEMRGQAVSLDEIFDGLTRGGIDFNALNWTDEGRRLNNLAISISKNSLIFHKLPNGMIGLSKWYGDAAKKKSGKGTDKADGEKADENDENETNGDAETPSEKLPLE